MARQVEWTNPAWDDLAGIAEYIARDSEYYAAAFVQEIKEAPASLAGFAERGQMVPEFGAPSIRELLVNERLMVLVWSALGVIVFVWSGLAQARPQAAAEAALAQKTESAE